MTDEKNKNERRFPETTVGVLIYNEKGEIFLVHSDKWNGVWHIPGGHIELGESSIETAKREIMEETGLEIDNVEFSNWQDAIYPKDFFKKKHFIFLDFFAKKSGGQETKSNEMEKWVWIDPKKALETLKINPYTTVTIKRFIEKQNQPAVNLKCEEYLNNWKRALADYKNLQTEIEKRRGEWIKMSEIMILEEFLPVYEHLKLAINNEKSTDSSSWLEGVKYVIKQFADVLNHIAWRDCRRSECASVEQSRPFPILPLPLVQQE